MKMTIEEFENRIREISSQLEYLQIYVYIVELARYSFVEKFEKKLYNEQMFSYNIVTGHIMKEAVKNAKDTQDKT